MFSERLIGSTKSETLCTRSRDSFGLEVVEEDISSLGSNVADEDCSLEADVAEEDCVIFFFKPPKEINLIFSFLGV
jgi:hypothetical protein